MLVGGVRGFQERADFVIAIGRAQAVIPVGSHSSAAVRWLFEQLVPDEQSHAQGAAGITGRRLNPDVFKGSLSQDAPVADAVERHTSGHAQVLHPGLAHVHAGPCGA